MVRSKFYGELPEKTKIKAAKDAALRGSWQSPVG
jgi:hypothetical protein